jgi:hypothetical protein
MKLTKKKILTLATFCKVWIRTSTQETNQQEEVILTESDCSEDMVFDADNDENTVGSMETQIQVSKDVVERLSGGNAAS